MDAEEEALDWGEGDLDQEVDADVVSLGGDSVHEPEMPGVQVESESESLSRSKHIPPEQEKETDLRPNLTESQAEAEIEKQERWQEKVPLKDQVEVIPNPTQMISSNLQSNSSSSNSPSSPSSSSNDAVIKARHGLPPDWTTVQQKDSNEFYYFHTTSGHTSRIRPENLKAVKDMVWVNPNTVGNHSMDEKKESQRKILVRESPPRSGSKRSAGYEEDRRSDDHSRGSKIEHSPNQDSIDIKSDLHHLDTNGSFPNKRLRTFDSTASITSPTTETSVHSSRREKSSGYRASPSEPIRSNSAYVKGSSRDQTRMEPPARSAQNFDSTRSSRDRYDSKERIKTEVVSDSFSTRQSNFNKTNTEVTSDSSSTRSPPTRYSTSKDWARPSGGNSIPLKSETPADAVIESALNPSPGPSNGAPSLLSRLSSSVAAPNSPGQSPTSETAKSASTAQAKEAAPAFNGLSIRGSALEGSKSSRPESKTALPKSEDQVEEPPHLSLRSTSRKGRESVQEWTEKREDESIIASKQRRSRSRSPSHRPSISNSESHVKSFTAPVNEPAVRVSRDSPVRDTTGLPDTPQPLLLDPNPPDIDRYLPPESGKLSKSSTSSIWLQPEEKKRLKGLLHKKLKPYTSDQEIDEEDDRRRAAFSDQRIQEGKIPREWRGNELQFVESKRVPIPGSSISRRYEKDQAEGSLSNGDYSRWRDGQQSSRRDGKLELKNQQDEDDFYREKRCKEEHLSNEMDPSSKYSSNFNQFSSKREYSSTPSVSSIPRTHSPQRETSRSSVLPSNELPRGRERHRSRSPPRQKSRLESLELHQKEKEIGSDSPPRLRRNTSIDSPSREIQPSSNKTSNSPSTSSFSEVKRGSSASFIHPDRLKALDHSNENPSSSSSIQDFNEGKIHYYPDNTIDPNAARNELGVPTGPKTQYTYVPRKYQPGEEGNYHKGGYRGGGFGGGFGFRGNPRGRGGRGRGGY